MAEIETFLLLAVPALGLAVAPGRVRADRLVPDPQLRGSPFELFLLVPPAVRKTVGKLEAVIRMDASHAVPWRA